MDSLTTLSRGCIARDSIASYVMKDNRYTTGHKPSTSPRDVLIANFKEPSCFMFIYYSEVQ